ncbi:VOC family protein [candidate division KSB1 bacterium]|nr:VOC family protein [candidate division KSB1 bacterium]
MKQTLMSVIFSLIVAASLLAQGSQTKTPDALNSKERRIAMPNPTAVALSQIGQISVNAHDLERAVAFYRDKLGMRHLFTVPHMAFFDCNGIRLMLGIPEKPEFDHPSSIIYFKVADIQDAHKVLSERGVQFESQPHLVAKLETYDLWLAFFRDSENNLLCLMSEVARN